MSLYTMARRFDRLKRQFSLLIVLLAALAGVLSFGAGPAYAIPPDGDGLDPTGEPPEFQAPVNGFTWSMERRFGRDDNGDGMVDYHWDPQTATYDHDYIHPQNFKVYFDGCAGPDEHDPLERLYDYRWTFDGNPLSTNFCLFPRTMSAGLHTVELAVTSRETGETATYRQDVDVKNLLIVSLGDSFASGEGNPDIPQKFASPLPVLLAPAKWQDERCHRSAKAGPAQAAIELEWADPHTSVTFISLACSGANLSADAFTSDLFVGSDVRIWGNPAKPEGSGVLGRFRGYVPDLEVYPSDEHPEVWDSYLAPQLQQLANIVEGKQIDALIISAGGNDIGFANVAKACIIYPNCANASVYDPIQHSTRLVKDIVAEQLSALPDRYDALKQAIESTNPVGAAHRLNIAASQGGRPNIFVSEYPDLIRNDNADYCREILEDVPAGSDFVFGADLGVKVTRGELEWLGPSVFSVLNDTIEAKTNQFQWHFVGGIAEQFAGDAAAGRPGHGYCASDRWVRRSVEAMWLQGPLQHLIGPAWYISMWNTTGTLHPNARGHQVYRDRLLQALGDVLSSTQPAAPPTFSTATSNGDISAQVGANGWLIGRCQGGSCTSDYTVQSVTAEVQPTDSIRSTGIWVDGDRICREGEEEQGFVCDAQLLSQQQFRWSLNIAREGLHRLDFSVKNGSGQVASFAHEVGVDLHDPTATATISPTRPMVDGWYSAPLTVTLSGLDTPSGSGVGTIEYRINNGEPQQIAPGSPVVLAEHGEYTLTYRAIDRAGRASPVQTTIVKVDKSPPETTATVAPQLGDGGWTEADVTVSLAATDSGAGVAKLSYLAAGPGGGHRIDVDGAAAQIAVTQDGPTLISYQATDRLGNLEPRQTLAVNRDQTPPSATFNVPTAGLREGDSFGISLAGAVDTGWALPAAPYTFDCGSGAGYGATQSVGSAGCTARDSGSLVVKGRLQDQAGHIVEYTRTLAIANVAPTATFNAPQVSVPEGSPFTLSFSTPSDPSSADRTAGFSYAFDCGAGYGPLGAGSSAECTPSDNGPLTVKGRVQDKDGGSTEYIRQLQVVNVAPSATIDAPAAIDEGSTITATVQATDAPGDLASLQYAFDCATGSFSDFGAANTVECSFADSGTRGIRVQVRDKDGAMRPFGVSVVIHNVDPTASFSGAPEAVEEGSTFVLQLENPIDPSSVDADDLRFAFDCGTGYGPLGDSPQASCTPDNGDFTVKGLIQDKDGGSSEYTASVAVSNVAPTATFIATEWAFEGSEFNLRLNNPVDIAADMEGLEYAFDCGDGQGYGAFGASNWAACSIDDDSTVDVKGKIRDKDGGISEYDASVSIRGRAPQATFSAPASVVQRRSINLVLADPVDSLADMMRLRYAFDCGDGQGYGDFSPSTSVSCPTSAAGTRTVKGKVRDEDGLVGEYSAVVTIEESLKLTITAPQQGASFAANSVVTLAVAFTDAEMDDTHTCRINWGDGSELEYGAVTEGVGAGSCAASHQYTTPGTYRIKVSVANAPHGDSDTADVTIVIRPAGGK